MYMAGSDSNPIRQISEFRSYEKVYLEIRRNYELNIINIPKFGLYYEIAVFYCAPHYLAHGSVQDAWLLQEIQQSLSQSSF